MDILWKTFGHGAVKDILNKQAKTGRFSHAYLFKGPEGVGKKSLAEEFAGIVLGTENLESHPDFFSLGLAEDEKPSVEDIRKLISKLSVKPFAGEHTVAIVDNAELLNLSSSNALLKTLEEPPASAIIILVAGGKVLETISSRCQVFSFNPLSLSEFTAFAESSGLKLPASAFAISGGSIGSLVGFSRDAQAYEKLNERVSRLQAIAAGALQDKLLAISEFAEIEEAELGAALKAWLYSLKSNLGRTPQNYNLISAVILAIKQMRTNMNKKFILQKLFLEN